MKLRPKSRLTGGKKIELDSLKVRKGDQSKEMDILYRAKRCWDGLYEIRRNRERLMKFRYGDQYIDKVEVEGRTMTEKAYWEEQGVSPKKNNMIAKMVRSVIGVYKEQGIDFTAVAIDREEQSVAEMMTIALQANRELNCMKELELRQFEEFVISGLAFMKESWGWKKNRKDTWTDLVNPNYMFFDGAMQDVRHWDCDIIGQIHDMSFKELANKFATTKEEYRQLTEIYANARDSTYMASYYHQVYSYGHERGDFFVPQDHNMCRVIEVWSKEQKPRYRCHDYATGEYFIVEENEYNLLEQINGIRLKEGAEQGIPQEEIPFIEAEWIMDSYWYYRYLSPLGHVLQEGETPFDHKEHPYTIKIYPFIDGKPHSLVEDSIDQQKFINELITLYVLMAKHSAKGLVVVDESLIPDSMTRELFEDQFARVNGLIIAKMKPGVQLPQQMSTNVSNFNVSELLKLEMGMFDDVTGVTGALQGKTPASGTAASLYAQQVQNASNTLVDVLFTFSNFLKEAMTKKVSNINQYYNEELIKTVVGSRFGGIKKYMPNLAEDVTFDLIVSEGMSNPQYKQAANAMYLDMFKMQIIDREQLLKFGDFPNGDAILQDIQLKADEIQKQAEQAEREGMAMA
ncbi:MAG: hypothetical protein EOM62_08060 [Bacteroidia bacterium]|nr:hypothetical protein [Bacteroidia bacterium]